jgi:hypothetical protein
LERERGSRRLGKPRRRKLEAKPKNLARGDNDGQEGEQEVSGFASCSDGEEGCRFHGEIHSKSHEKDDAGEDGQEEISPALGRFVRETRCVSLPTVKGGRDPHIGARMPRLR